MTSGESTNKFGLLIAGLMIAAGILVAVRLFSATSASSQLSAPELTSTSEAKAVVQAGPTSTPTPSDVGPLPAFTIGLDGQMPAELTTVLEQVEYKAVPMSDVDIVASNALASVDILLSYDSEASSDAIPVYREVFTVVDRFDTITPDIPWSQVQSAWAGENRRYPTVGILAENVDAINAVLGEPGYDVVWAFSDMQELSAALHRDASEEGAVDIAIAPFDQLIPELVVLPVDEQNPLNNNGRFDEAGYPLIATVYAHPGGSKQNSQRVPELLSLLPAGNRDPKKMTTVAMTGVTAMVRYTAARMDEEGSRWPAEAVGPLLSGNDITVISNEVPFVEGCETDLDPDNVVFCSKPEYIEALLATGVDLVGLTGNHQNDYGADGAQGSLQFYANEGLRVYGGGENKLAAMQPIVVEHNGNRIGFIGANSYGPPEAWATDFSPGSAPFDLNIMSAMIRGLKNDDEADVILAELQYQESYDVTPLPEQMQDFRALVRAGADVVTGVQSHVPQAVEFLDGNLILYGLGNFFFDQMWEQDTRDGLVAVHTIYEGRHISTQLLPTLLYDYGQPRWASAVDRARIMDRVFNALPHE